MPERLTEADLVEISQRLHGFEEASQSDGITSSGRGPGADG